VFEDAIAHREPALTGEARHCFSALVEGDLHKRQLKAITIGMSGGR